MGQVGARQASHIDTRLTGTEVGAYTHTECQFSERHSETSAKSGLPVRVIVVPPLRLHPLV